MRVPTNLLFTLVLIICSAQAEGQIDRPPHFLSKQCNEYALELHLDPHPFQDFVGSGFSLELDQGKAIVLIVVHDCSQYWIDGEDLGSAQDIQAWVLIHGPGDVRPVVGAERTLPTKTWFALFVGSTNPRVRTAKGAAGTSAVPIDSVSLDPPGVQRGGWVDVNRNLRYSWAVASPAQPPVKLLGMNNDVYFRDSTGTVLLNRIQVLLHVAAGRSQGSLDVVGETGALPLISPGTYPVTVTTFFPMWSRATLGLSTSGERHHLENGIRN